MEELFVQESAITTEKAKNENGEQEMKKQVIKLKK
jgi:hypothetical protein